MGSAIGTIIGGGTSMVGTGITGRITEKSAREVGKIESKAYEYEATIDEANADILKAATGRAVAGIRREGEAELGAQKARIGASGITADSFGLLTSEGIMNLEQDIQDFQLERNVQEFNLRSNARLKRLKGVVARVGGEVRSELTKVGSAFSIIGAGTQTAGGLFGGSR